MGICLDTEQYNREQEARVEDSQVWKGAGNQQELAAYPSTPPDGSFPMQNGGHVKFEPPKVPVIFVLGGPGSGKVTHCDNLMQEKRGITHINMTDLLQQYAIGNDMQDFSQLSSKTVTEVLMLEMKMSPAAKTYLVSGYPRSMRDVVEYSDKIQVVNGVVLISWRQKILERQIEYGVKLGHVVLSLAKMELNNFFKNVMPVAEYFDQSDMLITVNGERDPTDVYKDFRSAILRILGAGENSSALANGIVGVGADGIPGEIVGVEPAPPAPPKAVNNIAKNISNAAANANSNGVANGNAFNQATKRIQKQQIQAEVIPEPTPNYDPERIPPVLWVVGGPGSHKASLAQLAAKQMPGWVHLSAGTMLRAIAEADPKPLTEAYRIKQNIINGEMVPSTKVMDLLEEKIKENRDATGILLDGFPRDMTQVEMFENKFNQQPPMVLLDCSKLQLGRGRLDDSVSAFRRRLELFKELTLPMLKAMDADSRLTIVDGDTDTRPVQDEFNRIIYGHMTDTKQNGIPGKHKLRSALSNHAPKLLQQPMTKQRETIIHDLEAMPPGAVMENGNIPNFIPDNNNIPNHNGNVIPTISQQISSYANGGLHNGNIPNGVNHISNGIGNGHVGNGYIKNNIGNGIAAATAKIAPQGERISNGIAQKRDSVRSMFAEVDTYPIDSHI